MTKDQTRVSGSDIGISEDQNIGIRNSSPARLLRYSAIPFLLVLLWLPGLRLPITSDTTVYALLGENIWKWGTYAYQGLPYAKHLPLHPFLSYPFSWLFGFQIGMKMSTLFAGYGVLAATYFLIKKSFSKTIALITVFFTLFHHGFLLMTMLGSADLLFASLFLGSLVAFVAAETDRRWYLLAGVLLGCSCLTRYNGVPLFLVFPFYIFWKRPHDRFSSLFWGGMCLALGIFGLWFLRNSLVFGSAFHTDYGAEFSEQVPSVSAEILRNIWYYMNPLHNILPVLLLFSLYGLWREGRRQPLLVLGMLAGSALAAIWWVKGIRFVFPSLVILLGFAAAGVHELWQRFQQCHPSTPLRMTWPSSLRITWLFPILCIVIVATVLVHGTALCLYTYGSCNAWFDRTIGGIPRNLGLSSEGLYGISLARDWIDANAPNGANVLVASMNAATWKHGVFRADLHVVESPGDACPVYEISQDPSPKGTILFATESEPRTWVIERTCSRESVQNN